MTDGSLTGPDLTRRVEFSIVTPVYNPDRKAFEACVRSVREQSYPHWEWCLVDDQSTSWWVWPRLKILSLIDRRIKVRRRSENGGISKASNDALGLINGEYIVLLDNDDELDLNALAVVNHHIVHHPDVDYLYSDEDKIAESGEYEGKFSKPAWSPERLLCQNYCSHLSVIRSQLVQELGGFRSEFDGAQDHDLLLRLADSELSVVHIPEVLYHWRVAEGSTAADVNEKPEAVNAGRRAVEDAVARRNINGTVVDAGSWYHRVKRSPTSTPLVSLIIPTCGTEGVVWGERVVFLENLVASINDLSTYDNYEIIVVYDNGTDSQMLDRLRTSTRQCRLVSYQKPFNFSEKCNIGAVESSGDVLIFLNDDMEVLSPDWIDTLVAMTEDPTVGAVGPLLLFDNFTVQSAGHHAIGPAHFARGLSPKSPAAGGWPLVLNREVSGLTGACMAVRREVFYQVGGFSEQLPLNYNDVDFGYKIQSEGLRLLWTPDAALFHFESKSRETRVSAEEKELLRRLWGRFISGYSTDPFLR